MANKAKSGFSDVANLDDNKYEVIYYSGYLSSRQQIRDDWNVAAKQACNGGNYTALSGPDVENIKGMDRIVGTISCK
jgi:hypothetical protein